MSATNESMSNVGIAKALILGIANALVDQPEAVRVEVLPDGEGAILRLMVGPDDLGKVIGKQGRTARSIRTILAAASMKVHRRFTLDIQNGRVK
jgi:uncharacterized protein